MQKRILDELSQIDDEYYPYWKPYAGSDKGLFWTSLTVIATCPELATTEKGGERLVLVLEDLFSARLAKGLPTYRTSPYPDIGMTSLLAFALRGLDTNGECSVSEKIKASAEKYQELVRAVVELRNDPEAFTNVWCETLYPILYLSQFCNCESTPKRREQLDAAIGLMVLGESWRAGEIILPTAFSSLPPVLKPVLNNILTKYAAA